MSVGDCESMSLKAYKVVPQFGIAKLVNVCRMCDTCMFFFCLIYIYIYIYTHTPTSIVECGHFV